ncbi:hypothetical protein [Tropheryma whipplei]|uniref:hypothetical protein n=1 Tax=Tropheryma whipplei TaxID=2039 RepID=UPI0004B20601|nr:hypothetical protein [Tropheryma whipplei]
MRKNILTAPLILLLTLFLVSSVQQSVWAAPVARVAAKPAATKPAAAKPAAAAASTDSCSADSSSSESSAGSSGDFWSKVKSFFTSLWSKVKTAATGIALAAKCDPWGFAASVVVVTLSLVGYIVAAVKDWL